MKRLCSWLLTCAVLLSLLPAGAWAAEEEYAYSGGSGTQSDPYLIATAEDLAAIPSGTTSAYYLQTADIDLSGTSGWRQITLS